MTGIYALKGGHVLQLGPVRAQQSTKQHEGRHAQHTEINEVTPCLYRPSQACLCIPILHVPTIFAPLEVTSLPKTRGMQLHRQEKESPDHQLRPQLNG